MNEVGFWRQQYEIIQPLIKITIEIKVLLTHLSYKCEENLGAAHLEVYFCHLRMLRPCTLEYNA